MVNPSFGAASSSLPSEMARTSPVVPPVPVGLAEQQTMTLMAERTGGRAFLTLTKFIPLSAVRLMTLS